jgi:hypothetical protein
MMMMMMIPRSFLLLLVFLPTADAFAPVVGVRRRIPRAAARWRHHETSAASPPSLQAPLFAAPEEDINVVVEKVSGFQGGPIIRPFQPQRWWLWRRWSGTVLQAVLPSVAFNMCATMLMVIGLRKATGASWLVGLKPDMSHPLVARLALFHQVWAYLTTFTTFVLTFFLGEAFSLWKRVYTVGRMIQGRLNDISMLLATHAARDESGRYTPEAQFLLDSVALNIRAFHALLWASCSRHYRGLLTPQGLNLMVQRGLLTQTQVNTLLKLNISNTQYHNAVLEWIMIQSQEARRDGVLVGGDGLEHIFLEKCCTLRGTYATIGDILDGRMPLAYVHLVQIAVDTLLFTAPLALYSELGAFSVISVGILTLFYSGLMDLAKVLLDPLDNEDNNGEIVTIDLSVLVRESNDGSIRWMNGASILPFSTTS